MYAGAMLYAARMTRPDIYFCVNALARRTHDWLPETDTRTRQVFGYLKNTSKTTLTLKVVYQDISNGFWLEADIDSDHAADPFDGRSVSSGLLVLSGTYGSNALLDFIVKTQRAAAASSGEAEIKAVSDCQGTEAAETEQSDIELYHIAVSEQR